MKYTALFALALIIFTSCGDDSAKKVKEEDTTAKVEVKNSNGLKIAFYYQDSIARKFNYLRMEDSLLQVQQVAFQNEVKRRSESLQNYVVQQQRKAEGGLLSQNETLLVQQNIQQKEADLMRYQQTRGREIETRAMEKLSVIGKKLKKFSEDYSKENDIDILYIQADGGQLAFINPSMDVTNEFSAYLNKRQSEIESDISK
ncbi:MAG: OmpH family outer membrane protein [Crocinitomicaceae bacterium]|nr:OmpH family outer membrane protein [Crocinitomicaceae bacterium]